MCKPSSLVSIVSIAAVAIALPCAALHAQSFEAKVQEAASNVDDFFGAQVLRHDDVLFVAEFGGRTGGQVHAFSEQPSGWVEIGAFAPSVGEPGLQFGAALAADGDVVVSGSHEGQFTGNGGPGGAWVFVRDRKGTATPLDDEWLEQQALVPSDPAPFPESLGWSVAVSGGTALVGAPGHFFAPGGAVYVFARDDQGTPTLLDDTWSQQARLDPSPLTSGTRLGTAVALLDAAGLALASDPSDDEGVPGGVLQWTRNTQGTPDPLDDTWTPGDQIEAPTSDALGESFIVADGRLYAQAFEELQAFEISSRIDVFERSGSDWTLVQEIANPLPTFEPFGGHLAVSGDWLVTGGLRWQFGPPSNGALSHVFHRVGSAWTLTHTLMAPDQSVRDGFGFGVAVDGTRLLFGAPGGPYDDDDPAVEGAVYVLDLDAPNGWTSIDSGASDFKLAGWGTLDGAHAITVRTYDSFSFSTPAIFVLGFSLADVPFHGYQLIPTPSVLVPIVLGPNGDLSLSAHWPPGVPAGVSAWFQTWMKFGPFWLASNGLRVTQPAP